MRINQVIIINEERNDSLIKEHLDKCIKERLKNELVRVRKKLLIYERLGEWVDQ
jgi:hypothetical protein